MEKTVWNSEKKWELWDLHSFNFLGKPKTKYTFALQPVGLREPEQNEEMAASFHVSKKS